MKHILFVDDEKDLGELYQEFFITNGLKVTLAISGKEALKILEKSYSEIDLIISDYQMPDGNGDLIINFIQNLKDENTPQLIILSAHTSSIPSQELEFEIIKKPIALKKLMDKVSKYLS